jgi:non-homologous end joining protein Ku
MSTTSPEGPLGRPVWSGSITFGLVAVPVKLYSATEGHSGPVTHQYHADDLGRIRYRKYCEVEDRELRQDEIARGWEAPDGGMVVLTDDDLEQLPLPTKQAECVRVRGGSDIEAMGLISRSAGLVRAGRVPREDLVITVRFCE